MSIRNLFFRESECKKPSDSPFPCGLRASHPFWRPAPLCVAGFGLRCRCAACSPSVLRTLFGGPPRFASRASDCASAARRARPRCFAPFLAARPALRRGLRTAVALSGLSSSSVLRTLFGGPPRFASRASDCGSPFRAVLVLGASHPFWRPAPLRVAGFGLRCRCAACSPSVLRTLFGKQKPRTEARGVMIPFWFPCFENQR